MNCYHCGDTMVLKKLHDYGGYSWAWKCTHCGAIIDQILTGTIGPKRTLNETVESKKQNMLMGERRNYH
jgi:uncharacterized Zn finger protein